MFDCRILISCSVNANPCSSCILHNVKVVAAKIRNESKMLQPAKLKAPIFIVLKKYILKKNCVVSNL